MHKVCIINIMEIEFDSIKNKANIRDHKINFADVEGVFYDQNAITLKIEIMANSDLLRWEWMDRGVC